MWSVAMISLRRRYREATGYGAVYFAAEMLKTRKEDLKEKICLVSGSGNVAQYTIEKLITMGARAVTASDSGGFIYDEEGINREKLNFIIELKLAIPITLMEGNIAEDVKFTYIILACSVLAAAWH